MSILSVTSYPTILPGGIHGDALTESIEHLINALNRIPIKNFKEKDLSLAEFRLKRCLHLAGENDLQKGRIKEAIEAYNQDSTWNGGFLRMIVRQKPSFALLLIELDIEEVYLQKFNCPLTIAIRCDHREIVLALFKKLQSAKFDTHQVFEYALNRAVDSENSIEYVKLFLQSGVNPNKIPKNLCISPVKKALTLNKLSILALFFFQKYTSFKIDTDDIGTDPEIEKRLLEQNSGVLKLDFAKIPLFSDISCFTPYAANRDRAINYFLHCLVAPPLSVMHLIQPIERFVAKERSEDPLFNINIVCRSTSTRKTIRAQYDPETGNINLYVSNRSDPLKKLNKKKPTPVLLHEICHKIFNKLDWKNEKRAEDEFNPLFVKAMAAYEDIHHLPSNCHEYVRHKLHDLNDRYESCEVIEECIVRVPEIIFTIANENPGWTLEKVESILNENIPNLYLFYKNFFLPAVESVL